MQRVFVLDHHKQSLMPCHPARARALLSAGRAAVYRRFPFTIILKERIGGDVQPIEVKLDPGSKTTGIALVADFKRGRRVIWAVELEHRGRAITKSLEDRSSQRRSRRNRHTRYRPARFNNRKRHEGWLPPSLESRLANTLTWVARLCCSCPVTSLAQELVKFDTQLMQDAETSGIAYQQGTLAGNEVREYLLEKFGRKCVYCGKKDVPFEVEHITPRSRGGSDRVSNLTLSCHECNQVKGSLSAAEFGYLEVQAQAKLPLKDAAAINTTRWALFERLQATGLPLSVGTGGRTKFNRTTQGYPKAHWIDAACVGEGGLKIYITAGHTPLLVKATGHGTRQMCGTDKFGFPSRHAPATNSTLASRRVTWCGQLYLLVNTPEHT